MGMWWLSRSRDGAVDLDVLEFLTVAYHPSGGWFILGTSTAHEGCAICVDGPFTEQDEARSSLAEMVALLNASPVPDTVPADWTTEVDG